MEMSNAQTVPASPEQTWRALNDPETLKASIPGCESMEKISDTEYAVSMTARVGPVNAKFKGKMRLADLNPPTSYTVSFEGQGGAAGFAKGNAKVNLTPEGAGTRVGYTVSAQVGGKLAQVGSRLIDGAAKKIADDFFARFAAQLGAKQETATSTAGGVAPAKGSAKSGTGRVWLWVAVAVVGAAIIYYFAR
ncbi:MAG: CoxG family protein [Sulfurifustaceae bacterium]